MLSSPAAPDSLAEAAELEESLAAELEESQAAELVSQAAELEVDQHRRRQGKILVASALVPEGSNSRHRRRHRRHRQRRLQRRLLLHLRYTNG